MVKRIIKKEMTPNEHIKEKIKEFEEKFGGRLVSLETFYQVHGGEPYKGEVIPDFLQTALSEAYQLGQDSVRINNACSNPICPTIAQRIAPEMCPCRIAAQDELSDILSQLQVKNKVE